jgi:hypothetical protein
MAEGLEALKCGPAPACGTVEGAVALRSGSGCGGYAESDQSVSCLMQMQTER